VARYDIKRLVAAIPLAKLVGQYLTLRKSGVDDFVGLCPFHKEKSPSLHVHPERKFFKCFGCGAKGDALSFYARIESVSNAEAIKALAQDWGIEADGTHKPIPTKKKVAADLLAAECAEFWRLLRYHVHRTEALSRELDVLICATLNDPSLYHESENEPLIELGWTMIRARERWIAARDTFHEQDLQPAGKKMALYLELRSTKMALALIRSHNTREQNWRRIEEMFHVR